MSMDDNDIYNQPTQQWSKDNPTEQILPQDAYAEGEVPLSLPPPGLTTTGVTVTTASPKRQFSRRKVIIGSVLGLAGAGAVATAGAFALQHVGTHSPVNTQSQQAQGAVTGNAQIGHLLRRAGFGANPADLATYEPLGFSGAVDRLLNYQQVSDNAMETRLASLNLDLNKPADQQRWWLLRMAWTQRPLLEKMTLFWHGVLVSSFRKVGGPQAYQRMIIQNQFLRTHAFDTYDNILLGITADPAMLFYLDLTKSTKKAPNENYARELMELFTLGLGHYTQQDVYEGAAALTGWHVRGLSSQYYLNDHNTLTKTYLGQIGNFDYKDIVRILASNSQTPWFLARKLFTFFVYENPSNSDLQPLVDAYNQNNHSMGAVMKALLNSPQFVSQQAYRSRIKSPVEYVVGAYRALGIQNDGNGLQTYTTLIGQTVFDPPNVAGWPGDKVSALWLNSGTWMARLNYIDLLLLAGLTRNGKGTPLVDMQKIINDNHIDSPEHFVDYFTTFLLDGAVSSDRRAQFIDYFTTPDTTVIGRSVTLTNGQSYPLNRVRGTVYLMMASPEYQLN